LKRFILLYADKTIIVSDDPAAFQKLLDDFYDYNCVKWKLKINMTKTQMVIFGSKKISKYYFTINNEPKNTNNSGHYLPRLAVFLVQENTCLTMHILY
jgi:hypothetical protein